MSGPDDKPQSPKGAPDAEVDEAARWSVRRRMRATGEHGAVTAVATSAMRPAPVPTFSRPPAPPLDAVLARAARALDALGASPSESAVAEAFVAALCDLLPDRLVAVRALDEAAAMSAGDDASAEETDVDARACIMPGAIDGFDVQACAGGEVYAVISIERDSFEGDAAYDAAVANAVSPFLAHALRAARAAAASAAEIAATRALVHRADKLATLGQFAAGIIHELNNPLASILLSAQFVARHAVLTPDIASRVGRIVEAASRIQGLSRRLLAYARPVPESPADISVPEVLDHAAQFCEHVFVETGASLDHRMDDGLPTVRGVRTELTQVFVNLITNACHATQTGEGSVTVTAQRVGDSWVRVTVEDNGHGIAQENLVRIFEPFFTTKSAGAGTGLGLSIVRSILDSHGAVVHVESTPGRGTAFHVDLPCERASGP